MKEKTRFKQCRHEHKVYTDIVNKRGETYFFCESCDTDGWEKQRSTKKEEDDEESVL